VPFQIFDVAGLVTLRCDIPSTCAGSSWYWQRRIFVTTDESWSLPVKRSAIRALQLKVWIDSRTTREASCRSEKRLDSPVDFPAILERRRKISGCQFPRELLTR